MKAHLMKDSLRDFIAHARTKNMDHATIRMLLLSGGWKEKEIARAMTQESLDMAIPVPPDMGGARDAFLYLLTFVSLYTTVVSSIILLFDYINRLFPDAAFREYYADPGSLATIRWSMAAIIVAFPLFLFLSRFLLKEMREHAEKALSEVRRWLTYLTLFASAVAIIADVITLVFRLLDGELSVRFLLKVLVILVITGIVFTYYLLSLRPNSNS
jgi:hypothetical protein